MIPRVPPEKCQLCGDFSEFCHLSSRNRPEPKTLDLLPLKLWVKSRSESASQIYGLDPSLLLSDVGKGLEDPYNGQTERAQG